MADLAQIKAATGQTAASADILARHLLLASCKTTGVMEVREHLRNASRAWRILCRAFSDLETIAPMSIALGEDDDDEIRHAIATRLANQDISEGQKIKAERAA